VFLRIPTNFSLHFSKISMNVRSLNGFQKYLNESRISSNEKRWTYVGGGLAQRPFHGPAAWSPCPAYGRTGRVQPMPARHSAAWTDTVTMLTATWGPGGVSTGRRERENWRVGPLLFKLFKKYFKSIQTWFALNRTFPSLKILK
jgi:hypothetical protein